MASPRRAQPKQYRHVVMAKHPLTGKDMPITQPYDNEEDAYAEAARRNETKSHLQHHVKKIVKGNGGNQRH